MPLLAFLFALWFGSRALAAAEPGAIESDLVITVQGKEQHVSLNQALSLLDITSASIALIDEGRIAFARAYGKDATPDTLYQAASLSKFVAAIGAMRLVESGTLALSDVWQGFTSIFIHRDTLREVLTRQNGGPYGLGAAVAGDGASLVLMKRGQNVGYQGHLILYPASGQGMVVMTNSDNGSKLAEALIKRAADRNCRHSPTDSPAPSRFCHKAPLHYVDVPAAPRAGPGGVQCLHGSALASSPRCSYLPLPPFPPFNPPKSPSKTRL